MNTFFSVFLIGLLGFSSLASPSNDRLFSEATALYNKEKYEEAASKYIAIIESGKASAALYYNLGNAYYKQNQISSSIYYYEKALELAPNDPDIRNNLEFAQKATIDVIDEIPKGFIQNMLNRANQLLTIDQWALLSIGSISLFVILFICYLTVVASRTKKYFFLSSWIFLFTALLGVYFAFRSKNIRQNQTFAIVFAQETTIKSEPNLRSDAVFQLHQGTKVQVTETINSWKKIKLTDGKIGWIAAADIKEL